MKREVYALISMIIVLILILISFFTPWYSSRSSFLGNNVASSDIYLDRTTMGDYSISHGEREGAEYVTATLVITIIALITSILTLVGILGIHQKFGNVKKMRLIGISFGIVTFILVITAIFYFMMGTINVIQTAKDMYYDTGQIPLGGSNPYFWMNLNVEGMEISAGPGIAWYLMIVAGLIALVSTALLVRKPKSEIEEIYPVDT